MHLKLPLGVNFKCACCASGMVDIEAETPCGTCTYVDKSCIRWHHVSKDFCTPVINEVCSGSQEGKFWGRTSAQKNLSYCLLWLQTGTITATVRDSRHYSNNLRYRLTQHRTRTWVTGHHSPSVRTRSSMSFNGLELRVKLELERKPRVSS